MYKNFIRWERHILSPHRPAVKFAMRIGLSYLLLTMACTQLLMAHDSGAQSLAEIKVSLGLKNEGVRDLFRKIEKQTPLRFAFMENQVDKDVRFTIHKGTYPVVEVLNHTLASLNLTYMNTGNIVYIVKNSNNLKVSKESESHFPVALPEQFTEIPGVPVKGRVTDEKGEALPGVSILVKGTQQGLITDADGDFSIEVPDEHAVLVFSFVGYVSQEVTVGGRSQLDMVLVADQKTLEEIVVIGYGAVKKTDLTGAVGVISGKTAENQATSNLAQSLQGKIAGLSVRQTSGHPGAGAEIRIRGVGSFGASSTPLVVVDGIITNGGLTDLDPNSVESITVLKDASAAAIYGSRGANGVVLVTTKRGKSGKERISFQSYYSFDQVSRKIGVVDAATYGAMVNDFYTNQGKEAPYDNPGSLGKGTNWQDEIFRTGGKQNYSLSFSGGGQNSQHSVIFGHYSGEGVVVNSTYNRSTLRINNDIQPLKGLHIGSSIGLSYGVEKQGDPQPAINAALIYAPNVLPYNEDGSYGIADRPGQPTTMTAPLVYAYERENDRYRIGLLANTYAEYEISKGLKFRTSLGLEYINTDTKNFVPSYNFGLGNNNGVATLTRRTDGLKNYIVDNIITYSHLFAGAHQVDLMGGYTFQNERSEFVNAFRNTFGRNDENLQVLDAATANDRARGNYTEWALQSYLGRLIYSYDNKYLVTSSIRIDQSSRFAKGNRTGIFPSLSLGWVISNENFWKARENFISYLKLRGGYGVLGNQDVGIYPYQALIDNNLAYSLGNSQNVWVGAAPTSLANENISWEKTKTSGGGVEVNFLNDKLGIVAEYYDRRTYDVLVRVPLPNISGMATYPYQNVGSVRNSGVEFSVEYRNTAARGELGYHAGFNISINKNEVTKLTKGLDIILAGGGQGGVETRTSEGHGINAFYGHVHNGIFQTEEEVRDAPFQPNAAPGDIKFKDLDGDGQITADDRTFIGDFNAKQILGFNGGVKYRNIDFTIAVTGDFGRHQNIFASGFAVARAAEATNSMWADRWTGPGTSNYVPRIVGGDPNSNSRSSDFWVRKQDYLRIQNTQLGYNLPSAILTKWKLEQLRLYVAAQNLYTWTKFPGFDPETTVTSYPVPRSVFFGINLGF